MRRRLQLRLKPDGRRLRLEASCGRAGEGEEISRGEGEAVWCSADDKSTVQMREQAPADDGKLKRCGRSSTMALPMLWTPSGLSLLRILLPRLPFTRCPRPLAVGRGGGLFMRHGAYHHARHLRVLPPLAFAAAAERQRLLRLQLRGDCRWSVLDTISDVRINLEEVLLSIRDRTAGVGQELQVGQ